MVLNFNKYHQFLNEEPKKVASDYGMKEIPNYDKIDTAKNNLDYKVDQSIQNPYSATEPTDMEVEKKFLNDIISKVNKCVEIIEDVKNTLKEYNKIEKNEFNDISDKLKNISGTIEKEMNKLQPEDEEN